MIDTILEVVKLVLKHARLDIIRPGTQDRLEADRRLFKTFLETLPSNSSSILLMRQQSFGDAFEQDALDDIESFIWKWDDAEHEFLDKKLERERKRLLGLCNAFRATSFGKIYRAGEPNAPIPGLLRVPKEWHHEQPERWHNAVEELDDLADQIVKAHQDFIRLARKRLKV